MRYERDPLSVRYDATAGRLLGRAYARPGQWVYYTVRRPNPGPRTRRWLRLHGIVLDLEDAGGLARYERAFQRALYYNHGRNPVWSLQRAWGPVTARGRLIGVRAGPAAAARAAVARKPRDQQWTRTVEQQSGGIGSTKQRFIA